MTILAIQYIASDPDRHNGEPRIASKGVTVRHIARMHQLGWTAEQIAEAYDLIVSEVYAALSYYFGHKVEIDHAMVKAQQDAESVGMTFEAWQRRIAES